jgi:hypothetical protein
MNTYDVDKLMSEARRLAADYHRATGLTLPLSNEIARHDAMQLLRLQPACEPLSGVDAVGTGERAAEKYQIKGRVLFNESRSRARIGQLNLDGAWTRVVLVLMNEEYRATEIIEVTRTDIQNSLLEIKPNKRGAMTVAKFRALGTTVWQLDQQAA